MKKVLKLAPLCAVTALLSGCAKDIALTASLCGDDTTPGAWQTIHIRQADKITDPTSAKILQNNEARKAVCKDKGAQHG